MGSAVTTFASAVPAFLLLSTAVLVLAFITRALVRPAMRPSVLQTVLLAGAAAWTICALLLTLVIGGTPPIPGQPRARVDLIPFRDLRTEWTSLGGLLLLERGANLAVFLVGALLHALAWNWSITRTTVIFLAGGIAIETAQYFIGGRSVTADDMIMAAVGGLLGSAIAAIVRRTAWYRTAATGAGGRRSR